METGVRIILESGKLAVDLALYTLLPVLVVMMVIMEFLRVIRVLPAIEGCLQRPLSIVGLPPRGVVAMVELLLVSFAAPYVSLKALNDDVDTLDSHLAATLAAVLTMAQANVTFPLVADGLSLLIIPISVLGGLAASTLTFYVFNPLLSRFSPVRETPEMAIRAGSGSSPEISNAKSVEGIAKRLVDAAGEAVDASLRAIPFLLLGYGLVTTLRHFDMVPVVQSTLSPLLDQLGLPEAVSLAIATKYAAGGTAMIGVAHELVADNIISANDLNRAAGLIINPCDLVGLPVLLAGARRAWSVLNILAPALLGTVVGVGLRTILHVVLF